MIESDERTSVDRILGLAARQQTTEALQLASELGAQSEAESLMACRALIQGVTAIRDGQYEAGIRESLPALTHLERHGFRSLLDWTYSAVGFGFGMLGAPETGLEWVGRAIAGAERRSDEVQLRRSYCDEGQLLVLLDEVEKSVTAFEKALASREAPAPSFEQAEILNQVAHGYLSLVRRHKQAGDQRLEFARKALDLAQSGLLALEREPGDHLSLMLLENLGSAARALGKFTEAEEAFTKALALSEAFAPTHVELLTSYAGLLCELGRYAESDSLLTRAYNLAQTDRLDTALDRIFETRIQLAMLTEKTTDALLWSEQRFQAMESQYRRQLTSIAQNAEIFVELEQARRLAQPEIRQQQAETTVLQNSGKPSEMEANEIRDALTGCLNRSGFMLAAESFLVPGKALALVLVDVDHFKSIHDRFGHAAGNKALQSIAQLFNKSLRDADLVAHLDGEKFLLLINGVGTEAAWGTCERLRLTVERHGWGTIAPNLRVTISIGLAVRRDDEDLESLTSKANEALQRAKSAGHNRVISA